MTDLGANILRVVEILEVFGKEQARTEALEIVKTQSRVNFNALDAVMSSRPGYFSTSMIIECFSESSATGDELVAAMRRFRLPPDWVKALEICNDADLRPTFSIFHDSLETKAFAEQFLKDYVHYAASKMGDNWAELTRRTFELRDLAFEDVVERRTLLRMIANQMLSWWVESPNAKTPSLNEVVDVHSNKPDLLPVSEFLDTVIEKSNEYIEMSNPSTDDENLTLARRVLDVLASLEIAKDQPTVVKQRDLLNVIAKCIGMGSLRPPATYRYCEPDGLLAEVVSVGTNYKQVKTCAEVSKLLGFKTPSARALAYCAAQAFKAKDTSTGHRYIQQLVKTAKGFADIYHVCKDVIPLCEEPSLRLDLITCLTLNAPSDELPVLWELLSTFSPRDAADRGTSEEAQKEALLYSVLNYSGLSPTKQLKSQ
ncbi:Protein SMGL-1 [Aphelenchoides avenae]|nr:Protein SMGL-1 [Aphelenchus avenae]